MSSDTPLNKGRSGPDTPLNKGRSGPDTPLNKGRSGPDTPLNKGRSGPDSAGFKPSRGLTGTPQGEGLRIGIAAARFNGRVTELLVESAFATLTAAGVADDDIILAWVPGAFELPLLAQTFIDGGTDAVLCLGAVIRGETAHFDFVAGECAAGIQRVALDADVPVIFGVLTSDTVEQALDRAGGKHGNKGAEAASAALEMIDVMRQISRTEDPPVDEENTGPRLYKA